MLVKYGFLTLEEIVLFIASNPAGATAMTSESETDEADMGRLQGKF